MECPIAKSVYKATWDETLFCVREVGGHLLTGGLLEAKADYIVQAINGHEKLVDVCRNALTSLAITMLPRLDNNVAGNNDIVKIVISSLEQALKEAENQTRK